tara:strand:+ start:4763 stop:5572 length:810 start_codon:yes stop_codon:yes gene_type:complete
VPIPALQSVQIDGSTLSWREAGEGDALVMLHGIGGSSESWEAQLNELSKVYRVIAWDMPGYGESDGFENPAPTVDHYVLRLAQLFDHLKLEHAHILGQSIAAVIAARFCNDFPEKSASFIFAHGLTGLGGLEPAEREKAKQGRLEVFEALGPKRFAREKGPAIMSPTVDEAAREKAVRIMAKVQPAGFRQAVEMLAGANIFEDTSKIQLPSLVLCGADDPISPETVCRSVVAVLTNAQFCLIPDVGHYSASENPVLFNKAVSGFLADVA